MPIQLFIHAGKFDHYLIKEVLPEATMTLGAAAEQPAPRTTVSPGLWRFDIDDAANKVRLLVKLDKLGATPLVEQFFNVSSDPTRAPLDPSSSTKGRLHRRLRAAPVALSVPAAAGVRLSTFDLDLSFLDVTLFAQRAGRQIPDRVDGCVVKLIECTLDFDAAKNVPPMTWAVLAPPALLADTRATDVDVLLFYRPEVRRAYARSDDIEEVRFRRYFEPPPASAPFYVNGGDLVEAPNTGWAQQLARSQCNVLLLWPLPHVTDFGSAESAAASTVEKALECLWMEDLIAREAPDPPKLRRLGVGGFSSGGVNAANSVRLNGARISEAYFFDPANFDNNVNGPVITWYRTGGKKLRLMAGSYAEVFMPAIKQLLGAADPGVTVEPPDTEYWYRDSELYALALAEPPNGAVERLDAATTPTSTATSSASVASHLFQVSFNMRTTPNPTQTTATLKLRGEWTDGVATSAEQEVPASGKGVAPHEAASILRWHLIPRGQQIDPPRPVASGPVAGRADFDWLIKMIAVNDPPPPIDPETKRIFSIRHEWTVIGGKGTRDRGAGFTGYFQECLDASDFKR